jgi:HEPN domain-containing protein
MHTAQLTLKLPENIEKKLAGFMEFHVEARYPDEQKKFYKKCTKYFTEQNLEELKKIFRWLKKRL